MPYYTYILYSESLDKYYIGQCNDLDNRITRHNAGHGTYTKKGTPWQLVWCTEFESRSEAVRLERQIKKRGAQRYLQGLGI